MRASADRECNVCGVGLFERNKEASAAQPTAELAAQQLFQEAVEFPPAAIARIVASQEHPMVILAHALLLLVESGTIESEALRLLGIESNELQRLANSFENAASVQEVHDALSTHAALAYYHGQIADIFRDRFMILSQEQRQTFTKNLAAFAEANGLADLKLAYRLMVAEGLDPLIERSPE